jgi:hypothetical protein
MADSQVSPPKAPAAVFGRIRTITVAESDPRARMAPSYRFGSAVGEACASGTPARSEPTLLVCDG